MNRTVIDAPPGAGPCAKQVVTATIVTPAGDRFISTNYCLNPQTKCARAGLPSGVGYELCRNVCAQPGHAEENAIRLAGDAARGATLYLEGHTAPCLSCTAAALDGEIRRIVVGKPPKEYAEIGRAKKGGRSAAVALEILSALAAIDRATTQKLAEDLNRSEESIRRRLIDLQTMRLVSAAGRLPRPIHLKHGYGPMTYRIHSRLRTQGP